MDEQEEVQQTKGYREEIYSVAKELKAFAVACVTMERVWLVECAVKKVIYNRQKDSRLQKMSFLYQSTIPNLIENIENGSYSLYTPTNYMTYHLTECHVQSGGELSPNIFD